jgi:hypothetical protein
MIRTIGLILVLASVPAMAQSEPQEEICGRILKDAGGEIISQHDRSLHILVLTSAPGDFVPSPVAEGHKLLGFYCQRSDLVPARNDWKLLAAGYPLSIFSRMDGENRILYLELIDGRVRINSPPPGVLTQEMLDRIQAYARAAQEHF